MGIARRYEWAQKNRICSSWLWTYRKAPYCRNKSNKRRIGFVIQSYIGANVEQVIGKVYVQQARGEDLFNYHEHTKRPVNTMEKENIDIRNKANEALSKIFYSGLSQKGKF